MKNLPEVKDGARKITGRVVSCAADKTITVLVERRVPHPIYGKTIKKSSRFYAHDDENQCRKNDIVTIGEVRPLSKSKSWMLIRVDERAQGE